MQWAQASFLALGFLASPSAVSAQFLRGMQDIDPDDIALVDGPACFIAEKLDSAQRWSQICISEKEGVARTIYVDMEGDPEGTVSGAVNAGWKILCGSFVLFMCVGFAMLEAGAVRTKHVPKVMGRVFMTLVVSTIIFFLVGFALFRGGDSDNSFIGSSHFLLFGITKRRSAELFSSFFFESAVAGLVVTIATAACVERFTTIQAMALAVTMSGVTFPVLAHWVWDNNGALGTPTVNNETVPFMRDYVEGEGGGNGFVDIGGAGVIHMLAGATGLLLAAAGGARKDRFDESERRVPLHIQGHSVMLRSFGAFIVWFGWLFLAAGAHRGLARPDQAGLVAKGMASHALSGTSAAFISFLIGRFLEKEWDIVWGLQGLRAGLVSVAACAWLVEPWGAAVVGVLGSLVYFIFSRLLIRFHVDDPLSIVSAHGFCGVWGLLAVGVFGTDASAAAALGHAPNDAIASGHQIMVQLVGIFIIAMWTLVTVGVVLCALLCTCGIGNNLPPHLQQRQNPHLGKAEMGLNQQVELMQQQQPPMDEAGGLGYEPAGYDQEFKNVTDYDPAAAAGYPMEQDEAHLGGFGGHAQQGGDQHDHDSFE